MEYEIKLNDGVVEVFFTGDITFSENLAFRQLLKELEGLELTSGVFDLDNVGMVDSAGLGMFLIAREYAERAGWKLSVRGAKGHVASMLKLTKLATMLA